MNQYKYKLIFPYDPFVEVSYQATRGATRWACMCAEPGVLDLGRATRCKG